MKIPTIKNCVPGGAVMSYGCISSFFFFFFFQEDDEHGGNKSTRYNFMFSVHIYNAPYNNEWDWQIVRHIEDI